jgi:membrane protein YdbS with pleckstrin-like domain
MIGAGGERGEALGPAADIDWKRPSPRLRSLRAAQTAALAVPALLIALGAGLAAGSGVGAGVAAGAVAVLTAVAYWFVLRRVKAWGYAERDDDLLVTRGVMFRRLSIIPYGRMQYVDVTAGPFERLFGLATVRMHTAAAASDARIPALPEGEAARVRDALTTRGEARASGL